MTNAPEGAFKIPNFIELFKALGIPEPSEELAQEAYEADTEAEEKDLFEEKLEQEIQTPYQALE